MKYTALMLMQKDVVKCNNGNFFYDVDSISNIDSNCQPGAL